MSDEDIFKDVKKVAQVNLNSEVTQNIHLSSEKPPLPSNIPSPKGFIGRAAELTQLQTAKDSGKTSFVLHGAGGVGKTDLALEFIRRNKADYQADIRIDMQGLSDKPLPPKDARLEVVRAFEPNVPADLSDTDINNLYESLLNQHRTILFFDNARDRAQVESLNDASALIVITSRETFNVSGGFGKEIEQMSPADARQLLYSMADETRFDGQADALAYLAGYLPMALLPLAALLVSDITLEAKDLVRQYAARQTRLRLADPNRENLSVEASFDLSYDTLRDDLQTLWRKLAVFPADFDLEAMQAVWEVESGTTIRAELVNKHLLEFDSETKRSKLHDLARDYTNEKINDSERFQTEFAYCDYYGRLLAALDKITLENLEQFDLERANIENGFGWLSDKVELNDDFADLCAYYVGYAHDILIIRLHSREYIKWLETGLKASQKLNSQPQTGAYLNNLGIAYHRLGEYRKAIDYHERSLIIKREIDNRSGEGNSLGNLGIAYHRLGEYRKAIEYQERSLIIKREIGNRSGEGNSLGNLGIAYESLGEYRKAIGYHEQYLAISREIDDRSGEGSSLGNLGIAYHSLGEYRKAIGYHEQYLAISREIGNRLGEGISLGNLGIAYESLGEYRKAIDYHEQALAISREIGNRSGEGISLGNLGNAYDSLGEKESARDYYLRSIAILEAIESPDAEIMRQNLELLEGNG